MNSPRDALAAPACAAPDRTPRIDSLAGAISPSAGPSRSSCRRPRHPAPPCVSPSWRDRVRFACIDRFAVGAAPSKQRQDHDHQDRHARRAHDALIKHALPIENRRPTDNAHDTRTDSFATGTTARSPRQRQFRTRDFFFDIAVGQINYSHSVKRSTAAGARRSGERDAGPAAPGPYANPRRASRWL